MATILLEHLTDGWLRYVKKAIGVGGYNRPVLLLGVFMKVARQENSRVVYQQIDPPGSGHCCFTQFHAQNWVCYVPVHQNTIFGGFEHSSLRDVSRRGYHIITAVQ